MDTEIIVNNLDETIAFGKNFSKKIKPGDFIYLTGDLGSGKTNLVKAITLGLDSDERVTSPTFVVHRIYKTNNSSIKFINHFDLYRLENNKDIKDLGLEEIYDEKDSITIIEWSDRMTKKYKSGYLINIVRLNDNSRKLKIRKFDNK